MQGVADNGRPWWPYLALSQAETEPNFYHHAKRLLDVSICLAALIPLAPLFALIAILIKLDNPGPAFFVQQRIGAKRRQVRGEDPQWIVQIFPLYKFRTMRTDTDAKLHKDYMKAYISGDEQAIASLEPGVKSTTSYKLTGDPRVTRVGRFLRKTSLDELPQLWNVLIGDMSLVGPRPPIPYEVEMYSQEHLRRLSTIPGITGLWQVSGRAETTFEEMVELDLEYIERKSILLDCKILLRTLPAVISIRGAG
ncbi:MAG TPA: sugar transferase [Candidatus Binatia bacterium]|nr:sugar transferase [Candidatus Binatia bacterium]